jgi:hypothetical protein
MATLNDPQVITVDLTAASVWARVFLDGGHPPEFPEPELITVAVTLMGGATRALRAGQHVIESPTLAHDWIAQTLNVAMAIVQRAALIGAGEDYAFQQTLFLVTSVLADDPESSKRCAELLVALQQIQRTG